MGERGVEQARDEIARQYRRKVEDELEALRIKHARLAVAYADMLSRFREHNVGGVHTAAVGASAIAYWRKAYEEAMS